MAHHVTLYLSLSLSLFLSLSLSGMSVTNNSVATIRNVLQDCKFIDTIAQREKRRARDDAVRIRYTIPMQTSTSYFYS